MAGERYCVCGHLQADHEGRGIKLDKSACTADGCGCARYDADDVQGEIK